MSLATPWPCRLWRRKLREGPAHVPHDSGRTLSGSAAPLQQRLALAALHLLGIRLHLLPSSRLEVHPAQVLHPLLGYKPGGGGSIDHQVAGGADHATLPASHTDSSQKLSAECARANHAGEGVGRLKQPGLLSQTRRSDKLRRHDARRLHPRGPPAAAGSPATRQTSLHASQHTQPTLSWRLAGGGLALAPRAAWCGGDCSAAAAAGKLPGGSAWPSSIWVAAPSTTVVWCVRRRELEATLRAAGTGRV